MPYAPTFSPSPIIPLPHSTPLTLLLANTHSPTPSTRRLTVLTPHPQTPVVPQPTVSADLLQPLQVVAELAVHAVGQDLRVLAVDDVALPVEEPGRNLVLRGVLDNGDDALEFFGGEFAGADRRVSMLGGLLLVVGGRRMYRLLRSTSAFLHTKLL